MALPTLPFRFDESNLPTSPAVVADVSPGVSSKEALFGELYQRLRFPDYFGNNWDAVDECIRDLSWLPPGPVVLRHHDLPLAGDIAGQKTYLSILRDTVEKRHAVPGQRIRDLVVIFPSGTQEQIAWLLRLVDEDEAQWQSQ